MQLDIHNDIKEKLSHFKTTNKIPNIIFHGPSGCGKKTIVNEFINSIYNNDKQLVKSFVYTANCAHGKGIRFVRDELKFFAKTHIHSNGGIFFKSIILLNGDKLTMDAQSALRRCIEIFSHNTRFFIIVEDKSFLLKPVLSRFCEIYIPEPTYNNEVINLYKYNNNIIFNNKDLVKKRKAWLKKEIIATNKKRSIEQIINSSNKVYEKGYSALDIIELIEKESLESVGITPHKKYDLLFTFNKILCEIRNEKLIIMFILNFLFLSSDVNLENINFM